MPIVERTPRECFNVFANHLGGVVAKTVTSRFPLGRIETGSRLTLGFRQDRPVAVPVESSFGRLHFYIGQALEAVPEQGRYRLRTAQYWYRVQNEPSLQANALVRWEYDSSTPADRHARHHAQFDAKLSLGNDLLDLNKAHLPTGWVTIEEVIRFLIVDLGIKPPCGEEWPQVLQESERRFYEDFTGKRYSAPE